MYLILKISRPSSSIVISFNSRIFLTAGEMKLNPKLVFSCFKMYYDADKESLVWKGRDFSVSEQEFLRNWRNSAYSPSLLYFFGLLAATS